MSTDQLDEHRRRFIARKERIKQKQAFFGRNTGPTESNVVGHSIRASTNEATFACYLANQLHIRVEWDPFHPDLIASASNATLAVLVCQFTLPLSIQIDGVMTAAICLKTEFNLTMTILAGVRQHSLLLDGQQLQPGPLAL